MQSAYRRYHSTETALLRVNNDLLRAEDQHQEAVLVLLDLSPAFDTIDHETLLQRLATRYGISDTVLSWFTSYLSGRVQAVSICGTLSDFYPLRYGVPQSSVIGPILFTLYSAALQDIVMAHGLNCVMYADDTQLYMIYHPSDKACALQKLQVCWWHVDVDDVGQSQTSWSSMTARQKSCVFLPLCFLGSCAGCYKIGSSSVGPSAMARNLGVAFDNDLSTFSFIYFVRSYDLKLAQQVNNICRSAAIAIYRIGQIRKYLDMKTTERLIQ